MIKIAQSDLVALRIFSKLGASPHQMQARVHDLAETVAAREGVAKTAAMDAVVRALVKNAAEIVRTPGQKQRMADAQRNIDPGNRGTAASDAGVAALMDQAPREAREQQRRQQPQQQAPPRRAPQKAGLVSGGGSATAGGGRTLARVDNIIGS